MQVLISAVNITMYEGAVVTVFTGSTLASLVSAGQAVVAFNGDTAGAAGVLLNAVAGQTYQIAIHGVWAVQGKFELVLVPPPANDDFADATDLGSAGTVTTSASNVGTLAELAEPDGLIIEDEFWMPIERKTVWWRWQAPATGLVQVDTLGSSFDTLLNIYTGTALDSLTRVASSGDANEQGNSNAAFQAVAGTFYYIQVAGERTTRTAGLITLNIRSLENPATAADHIARGRAYLQQQTDAGLTAAGQEFQAALAMAPGHPEASILSAMTRFALLEKASAFAQALTGLGILNYNVSTHHYDFPRDAQDKPVATPGTHTQAALDYLQQTMLPALQDIATLLNAASSSLFTTSLSDSETGVQYISLDAGDISMLKATVYALQATIRILQTYDAGFSVATAVDAANNGELHLETLVDSFANLLTLTASDQRAAFKTAYQQAVTHFQTASAHIRTVRGIPYAQDRHLFRISPRKLEGEADVRGHMQKASDSFDGPVVWGGETINLSTQLTTTSSPRAQLPGLVGNRAVAGTTPEPTFDNAIPAGTQAKVSTFLRKRNMLHEVGTYGNWLTYFLRNQSPANQMADADPDGDMLINFAEFAFGLDPTQSSSPDEFTVSSLQTNVADGQRYLYLTFVRRIVRTDIEYIVAVSDNLSTWDRTQVQVQQVGAPVPTGDGETEQVTFRVLANPAITDRKFVRVEVNDLTAP